LDVITNVEQKEKRVGKKKKKGTCTYDNGNDEFFYWL
jgi:hypothetical protein